MKKLLLTSFIMLLVGIFGCTFLIFNTGKVTSEYIKKQRADKTIEKTLYNEKKQIKEIELKDIPANTEINIHKSNSANNKIVSKSFFQKGQYEAKNENGKLILDGKNIRVFDSNIQDDINGPIDVFKHRKELIKDELDRNIYTGIDIEYDRFSIESEGLTYNTLDIYLSEPVDVKAQIAENDVVYFSRPILSVDDNMIRDKVEMSHMIDLKYKGKIKNLLLIDYSNTSSEDFNRRIDFDRIAKNSTVENLRIDLFSVNQLYLRGNVDFDKDRKIQINIAKPKEAFNQKPYSTEDQEMEVLSKIINQANEEKSNVENGEKIITENKYSKELQHNIDVFMNELKMFEKYSRSYNEEDYNLSNIDTNIDVTELKNKNINIESKDSDLRFLINSNTDYRLKVNTKDGMDMRYVEYILDPKIQISPKKEKIYKGNLYDYLKKEGYKKSKENIDKCSFDINAKSIRFIIDKNIEV